MEKKYRLTPEEGGPDRSEDIALAHEFARSFMFSRVLDYVLVEFQEFVDEHQRERFHKVAQLAVARLAVNLFFNEIEPGAVREVFDLMQDPPVFGEVGDHVCL